MSKISIEDMCLEIEKGKFLKDKEGKNPTATEIYNYSPTGELFMIFTWYGMAIEVKKMKSKLDILIKATIQELKEGSSPN